MPIPVSNAVVLSDLRSTLREIDEQIDSVKEEIQKQIAVLPYPDDVTVYMMKQTDGRPVLTDLLVAKSNCLLAIATLQAKR